MSKYWDGKVEAIRDIMWGNDNGKLALGKLKRAIRQIATDQMEACVKALNNCSRYEETKIYWDDADEAIRTAAIKGE